jgi:hypothetical protein
MRVKSDREFRAYQQQARDLWFSDGSCTGGGEYGGGSSVKSNDTK